MHLRAIARAAAICLAVAIAGCAQRADVVEPAAHKPLTVFVGAASKPATEEAARLYTDKTGIRVQATFAGSGALLTQFATERFGDVYMPGSDDFMDRAQEQGAILEDSRTELAYLVPAMIVARGNPGNVRGLDDLAREDVRLVLAQPRVVCLGDVSEGILMEAGLWEQVRANVASFAVSCEDTLNMLLLGEADAIIAWDAYPRQHPDRIEAVALPEHLVRVRNIPAAVITWSEQPQQARAFIAFLASEEGKAVFRKHHYRVEGPGAG